MKKEKKTIKKYPLTSVLLNLSKEHTALKRAEEILSKPRGLMRKIDAEALIVVSEYCGKAHKIFWETAYEIYPDLEGKDAVADEKEIIVLDSKKN